MQLDTTAHADMNNDFAPEPIQEAPKGWFESINEKFQEAIASKEVIVETLIYFVVGAALGFLAKKYLKHLLIALVLLVILIKGLEWANVGTMTINWDHVKEITGLSPDDSATSIAGMFFAWVQSHIRQTIAIVVGILIGSKIG